MYRLFSYFYKALVYLGYQRESYLFHRSKKYITSWGEGSYGQPRVISFDKRSTLSVGAYCSIAPEVAILLGANHKKGHITTFPLNHLNREKTVTQASEQGDVVIGSDVWIGYGATIIGPVTIGDGAIIGAEALVVKDVPPYAVVGGVPTKVIKYRFNETQIQKLLSIAWWKWDRSVIESRYADFYESTIDTFIHKYE
jgi:acetyltransferase-like isoleucine patch superfamily enzyme